MHWETDDPGTLPTRRQLDRFLMMYGKALPHGKSRAIPTSSRSPERTVDVSRRGEPQLNTWVRLPFGGAGASFDAIELVRYLKEGGRSFIVQGAANCRLAAHKKRQSLDYWLRRNFTRKQDTKQAVNEVMDQLVATRLFPRGDWYSYEILVA